MVPTGTPTIQLRGWEREGRPRAGASGRQMVYDALHVELKLAPRVTVVNSDLEQTIRGVPTLTDF